MSAEKTIRRFLPSVFWAVLVGFFIILATSLSLAVAGYQFDWRSKRLTQTAVIYLSGQPRQTRVIINGRLTANQLPLRLAGLVPGEYSVTLVKEGYSPWTKTFNLGPGEAQVETNILLFLSTPEVTTVSDPDLVREVLNNISSSPLIDGDEIRLGKKLVTRVSGQLVSAASSPTRRHIFFQVGREIRVIENDGSNELVLATLENDNPAQIIVLSDGTEAAYRDGEKVLRLRLQ